MISNIQSCDLQLTPYDNGRLMNLCGHLDENIRQIEGTLGIEINNRANIFQINGTSDSVNLAQQILTELYLETGNGHMITPEKVHLSLKTARNKKNKSPKEVTEIPAKDIPLKHTPIKPRGESQQLYVSNIENHDVNIGVGPAGTGKTYLAVASAVAALEKNQVKRILLTRPAVEAGERLGFLPGDLAQKIDPYLRPLYDALYEMLGFERVAKLVEQNVIEIAPLAYMRGRTLNNAFIILDESQNTTIEQMKMFLTRVGFGSKVVITGDVTQVDLPKGVESGLRNIITVLKDIEAISFTFFSSKDVVRHSIVQKIVEAYAEYEKSEVKKNT